MHCSYDYLNVIKHSGFFLRNYTILEQHQTQLLEKAYLGYSSSFEVSIKISKE